MKINAKSANDVNKVFHGELKELNDEFYNKFNVTYFRQKVSFLVALLSDTQLLSDIYKKGIDIDGLQAKGDKLTQEEDKQLKELLKAEISLVYYHAIETLLRLLIAHTYKTECPWVEIGDLNSYRLFKKEVEKICKGKFPSKDVDQSKIVAGVIFGGSKPKSVNKDQWKKNLDNTLDWLNLMASDLLNNEDYNAYKHGLGLFSSSLGFELSGTPLKQEKSDVLVYITQEKDGDYINYFKTFKYINWQQKAALIFQVTYMMENIIAIGKATYLGNAGEIRLHLFHELELSKLFKSGINANLVKMSLSFSKKVGKSQN